EDRMIFILLVIFVLSLFLFFLFFFFFFFFQAEDGIRDYKVTGVQTCALPILRLEVAERLRHLIAHADPTLDPLKLSEMAQEELRSEERRVGKECRSRWST